MIYLIYPKNIYKYSNVPPPSTRIKKDREKMNRHPPIIFCEVIIPIYFGTSVMNHATYTTGTQRMRITSIIKQGRSK
jgi:hypothetical protein